MRAVWVVGLALLLAAGIGAERAPAETDAEIAALNARANELHNAGKSADAIPFAEKFAAAMKVKHGDSAPQYATALNNLAQFLKATNRLAEAEPLMHRALAIDEASFGREHPDVAGDLNNLAALLRATNRLAEAEPLMRRALAIYETSLGKDHPHVATAINSLALLLKDTNRLSDAEALYRRALTIDEASFGPDHPEVATDLNNLAQLLKATNRLAEAEPLMRRALAIEEASFGRAHPSVARDLNNLARLLQDTNRLVEAEPLMRRALAIWESSLGKVHPQVATALNNLSGLHSERGDWAEAAQLLRRAVPVMTAGGITDGGRSGLAKAVLSQNSNGLRAAARALHRAAPDDAAVRAEAFEIAQWATQSGAAEAVAQMSVRFARGSGPLAETVRARQDLLTRRQGEDKRLLAAVGAGDAALSAHLRARLAALDTDLDALDARLARDFPEYADLASPKPLSLAAAQAELAADEALLVFLDIPKFGRLPEETLAWVATKDAARWASIPLGTAALADKVAALRCGLDSSNWADDARKARCEKLLGGGGGESGIGENGVRPMGLTPVPGLTPEPAPALDADGLPPFDLARAHELYPRDLAALRDAGRSISPARTSCIPFAASRAARAPAFDLARAHELYRLCPARRSVPCLFDLARAYELYQALFGPFADLTRGKHLIVVPAGPLTTLPFHVLVTSPSPRAGRGPG